MGKSSVIEGDEEARTPEQVVRKLAQADRMLGEGRDIAYDCQELGVVEQTCYRRRNPFSGVEGR